MIRDVNFSFPFFFEVRERGRGAGWAKGAGAWWCHAGYLSNLAWSMLAKRCSICWGLVLHLPVNERCCWRYPCVPCHETSRRHLHLTLWPRREMTDVFSVLGREPGESGAVRGPGWIANNNCYNTCTSKQRASALLLSKSINVTRWIGSRDTNI